MKHFRLLLIFSLLSVQALYAQHGNMPAKVVTSKVVEKEIAKTNEMVGIVDFEKISEVCPEITGLIDESCIEEGKYVNKGDVLVKLNSDFTNIDLKLLENEIEQTEIELENLKKNLDRYEILFKSSTTSEQKYEDTLYGYRALQKKKEYLETQVSRLKLKLERSVIKAPFSGIIVEKYKEIGEWIDNSNPVCKIVSTEALFIKIAVSEDILKYQKMGEKIDVYINSLNIKAEGEIFAIIPYEEIKSKTFYMKIKIPYFEQAMQNMTATVFVPVTEEQNLRMVARDAIVKYMGQNFVYTVNDGKAKQIPINIVAFFGDLAGVDTPEIKSGMPLIVDGNDRLAPGQSVIIVGEN